MPFESQRAKLVLDPEEQNRLEALNKSYRAPVAHVERTLDRALAFGVQAALDDLPRPRRPRRELPQEGRAWVVALACQKPKELGYSEELWTMGRLALHQNHCEETGHPALARVGRGTVWKTLSDHELRPHKTRYYLEWRRTGRPCRISTGTWRGTTSTSATAPSRSSAASISSLARRSHGSRSHIAAASLSLGSGTSMPITRFELVFTPTRASWLNLIEVSFSKLARTLLRGIRVASKAEFKERIEGYLAELNETPVVFRWSYGLGEDEDHVA